MFSDERHKSFLGWIWKEPKAIVSITSSTALNIEFFNRFIQFKKYALAFDNFSPKNLYEGKRLLFVHGNWENFLSFDASFLIIFWNPAKLQKKTWWKTGKIRNATKIFKQEKVSEKHCELHWKCLVFYKIVENFYSSSSRHIFSCLQFSRLP